MRPVLVKLPSVASMKLRKAASSTVATGNLQAAVKQGGARQFIFVASGCTIYLIGHSSATITNPDPTAVDGGTEAARPVPLADGVQIPYFVDLTNCYFEFITSGSDTGYLTVYEA